MINQKGVVHLLLPLVLLLIIGVVVFLLINFKIIKLPSFGLPNPFSKQASISVKSEYQNPFKKETQYVNPFEEYKNPFVVSK